MIALTDQQLDEVKRAAAYLPPYRGDNFLRSVAGRLSGTVGRPSDYELSSAIGFVLGCYGLATGRTTMEKPHAKNSISRRR
jgi:hypothetical protein